MLKFAIRLGACSLLLLSACHAPGGQSGKVGGDANWTSRNAAADESAFSRLDQIKADNVGRLGLAWSMDLPGEVSLEATPVAVDGVLYFTGSYATVYAVDGVSGKLLWKYAPETWKNAPNKMMYGFAANRGLAYDNGKIFSAALDGRLLALDAKTGKLLWSVDTTGPMQTVTGAPRTFAGKVILGQGGADFGQRGYVTAYDQASGKQVWRFFVVPASPQENKGDPAMEKAATTWSADFWKKGGGGGGPWDSITFDSELNRIYVGTANAYSYDPEERSPGGGDNLYTASVVALDADTGKYVWHYQMNPRDSWDFDATQQMTVATLNLDGKPRKVLMQAPKNGFFYVLDRTTGKLISAEKFGKATWADSIDLKTGRPVEQKDIRYETGDVTIWPGSMGAHSWQSMSYSPKAGLVYIPYMQLGVHYSKGKPIPGGVFVGGLGIKEAGTDPQDGTGALVAWDPVKQKAAWRAPLDTLWNGGALSTAGDVVFWGGADGHLRAYNATSGARLWDYDARMGIMAAPMSWSKDGKQYVSVLAGYGASAAIWSTVANVGWKYTAPRRLLTFALDGKAALPPTPARDVTIHPVDDPKIKLDPAQVEAGHQMFLACAACHGRNLVGAGGPAPDLRESQAALDPNVLYSIVHDGALMENGMPRFPFSRQQTDALYAYIRDGARKAVAAQPAQPPAASQAH